MFFFPKCRLHTIGLPLTPTPSLPVVNERVINFFAAVTASHCYWVSTQDATCSMFSSYVQVYYSDHILVYCLVFI